jgi:hypothetical protein
MGRTIFVLSLLCAVSWADTTPQALSDQESCKSFERGITAYEDMQEDATPFTTEKFKSLKQLIAQYPGSSCIPLRHLMGVKKLISEGKRLKVSEGEMREIGTAVYFRLKQDLAAPATLAQVQIFLTLALDLTQSRMIKLNLSSIKKLNHLKSQAKTQAAQVRAEEGKISIQSLAQKDLSTARPLLEKLKATLGK